MQVLRDPRQKRFFKAKDMSDLFQLGDQYAQAPETAQIFAGVNSEIPLLEAGEASTLTTPTMQPPESPEVETNGKSGSAGRSHPSPQILKDVDDQGMPHSNLQHLYFGKYLLQICRSCKSCWRIGYGSGYEIADGEINDEKELLMQAGMIRRCCAIYLRVQESWELWTMQKLRAPTTLKASQLRPRRQKRQNEPQMHCADPKLKCRSIPP